MVFLGQPRPAARRLYVYGAFVEKVFGVDAARPTPVKSKKDGVDYIELPRHKIFLIQLLNIAGLGPVIGPILGALYGPSALLWVVLGCIFGGAVHDYCSAMMSLRYGGASYPEVIGRDLGSGVRHFMEIFAIIFMIMVGAVFVLGPAALLANMTGWNITLWTAIVFAYYFLATILPINTIIGRIYPFFSVFLLVMAFGLAGALLLGDRPILPNTDFFVNTNPSGLPDLAAALHHHCLRRDQRLPRHPVAHDDPLHGKRTPMAGCSFTAP
ncbi:MAG: carbon starvation CstA family protein [Bilophila sp.]